MWQATVVKMAIGSMVMAACGHPTQMGRVCAVLFTHGLYPWVTQLVVGRASLRVCARGLCMGHPTNINPYIFLFLFYIKCEHFGEDLS